jgi:hypothetical protein
VVVVGVGVAVAVVVAVAVGVAIGVAVAVVVAVEVVVVVVVEINMNPICMSCRRIPGTKKTISKNGKNVVWRCQACLDRNSVSFLKKDEWEKTKRRM